MNLTNSQYDRLMARYSQRRQRASAGLDERRIKVYADIPQLRELEARARHLSYEYVKNHAKNTSLSSKEFEDEMESLKSERVMLLKTHGFDENYLEPVYECPDCKDTGYIGSEKCHCLKKQAIELFYNQSGLGDILKKESFENFDLSLYPEDMTDPLTGMTSRVIMKDVYDSCTCFVKTFDDEFQNLLLYGDTGIGKTFLAHCIAGELLKSGHSVLYLDAIGFFEILEARQFDKDLNYQDKSSMFSYLTECELLIVDDLGTELTNSFTTVQLYHVIERRLMNRLHTIITTNLSIQDMNELYTERIFSRIMKNYQMLRLIGKDIRLIK